ncbi:14.7 kDa ribonuclease H-like protein [Phyllobates terribilis]|uniref:14.7 kDa ribonuclease H-like protein n=1 Tax=Phyllobates terribilis TaxID=111132 RepID=UPI003CCAF9AB
MQKGVGEGISLISPEGVIHKHAINLNFAATNNEAEYEALIEGMEIALENSVERVEYFCDSEVIVQQMQGVYEAKTGSLPKYLARAGILRSPFKQFLLTVIPHDKNEEADNLAKIASRLRLKEESKDSKPIWTRRSDERAIRQLFEMMAIDMAVDDW